MYNKHIRSHAVLLEHTVIDTEAKKYSRENWQHPKFNDRLLEMVKANEINRCAAK